MVGYSSLFENIILLKIKIVAISYNKMYQIQLKFKAQVKKITIAKSLASNELSRLIAQCFNLSQQVVGITDRAGKFYDLSQLNSELSYSKETFSLVTAKDLNQQSMSFATQYNQKQTNNDLGQDFQRTQPTFQIPTDYQSRCLGLIGNLELFEELILVEQKITIVAACIGNSRPSAQISFDYYLYPNETKNSVYVYSGTSKVCQFYINDWNNPSTQVTTFIQGLMGDSRASEKAGTAKSGQFKRKSKVGQGQILQEAYQLQNLKELQKISSMIQNLNRLQDQGEISQLQFYKLKSQALQNPQQFMRKNQMGPQSGLRNYSRSEIHSKQEVRQHGRSSNRTKRYEIPIIVRKYNNVVQKISTSYPLTLQQQQAINLILELQLKGLITQKEAGLYKSQILQQDQETFKLFRQYFEDIVDQIQLANKLRKRKEFNPLREESREKSEHDMRLLIKYAKQNNYELLRRLALQGNRHVLTAMSNFRATKNVQVFVGKLQKIASFYRAKQGLQQVQSM